jgi:glycosyltransferase involved in cell wall biosynthesis
MSQPSVSVIIPSYNSGHWVTQAVDSALAQTLRPIQIIVIDDGSKDDTRQRMEPLAGWGVEYVYQQNAGVSAARNAGVKRAAGDLVAFLDADDVWHPRKLELQAAVMAARPELVMLGSARFDWPGPIPSIASAGGAVREIAWRRLLVKNYFITSSIVVRRTALAGLGPNPFDGALQGPEDYDLWLRLAENGKAANLDLPLTGYRSHLEGLGNQPQSMQAGMSRILDKLAERGAWTRAGDGVRRRARAYFHFSCALMHSAAGNQSAAMGHAMQSLAVYPLPLDAIDGRASAARLRLLTVIGLRLLRIKAPVRSHGGKDFTPAAVVKTVELEG